MKQLGRQLRKEGCVSDEFSRVLSIDNGVGYICCCSSTLLVHCRKLKLVWNRQRKSLQLAREITLFRHIVYKQEIM
jgi:hypothetical protein